MVIILFTGCKSKQEFVPQKQLDCSFSYENNGIDYVGRLKSYDYSHLEKEMLSPALVKGSKHIKDENGGRLLYKGLTVSSDNFNEGIFEKINQALNKISLNGLNFEKYNDSFTAKANNLKLSFNNDGYLTKMQYNDIVIDFFDHKK